MPGPNPFPCGGKNQPACPPVPAIQVNPGDVIETPDGQKYVIPDQNDQGEDQNQGQ